MWAIPLRSVEPGADRSDLTPLRAIVRWLRTYNTKTQICVLCGIASLALTSGQRRPVRFYAIDMSYTGPWGSRPTPAGLRTVLAYLGRVDGASARAFQAIFEPWLRRLADPNISLTTPEHDAFTSALKLGERKLEPAIGFEPITCDKPQLRPIESGCRARSDLDSTVALTLIYPLDENQSPMRFDIISIRS